MVGFGWIRLDWVGLGRTESEESDKSDGSDKVGPLLARSASVGRLVDRVEARNLRAGLNRFFIKSFWL